MGWEKVVHDTARYSIQQGDCIDVLKAMPDRAVQLTLFSPPYSKQRTYGIGFNLSGQQWVDWMRLIMVEACRVTDGLVVVNAVGPVNRFQYQPIIEWLVADLTRHDGIVCGPAPWCWWKVCGTPGSGGARYQRRDWEPLYGFCLPDRLPLKHTDNTWGGGPPKCGPGGEFSNRRADGSRRGDSDPWKLRGRGSGVGGRNEDGTKKLGTAHTKRMKGKGHDQPDTMETQYYVPPVIANPGNVIQAPPPEAWTLNDGGEVIEARVGGNAMGNPLAHQSEAPMAMKVAERLICQYSVPKDIIFDPMCGSGTTLEAALRHNRRAIGVDIRQNQADLANRRVLGTTHSLLDHLDDTTDTPDSTT